MSKEEAVAEAKRLWGATGDAWVVHGTDVVHMYAVGVRVGEVASVRGTGSTWEAALARAQAA